ncbi:lysoplasmalogenase [Flavobacteriaceae bacterium]|mgnify:FL=1|nr:lysoplasmalogenase [Flavobacteriaceae bacterium]
MLKNSLHLRLLILISAILAIVLDGIGSVGFFVFKPLTTILILLLPTLYQDSEAKIYVKSIVFGLVFCLFGDAFLLFNSYFLFGLGSFLIGHLFFLYAFVKRQGWQKRYGIGLFLVILAIGICWLIQDKLNTLLIPVLLYMLVIVLMSWQGWGLALNSKTKNLRSLGLGVSLFMFSDTLIAFDKFYIPFSYSGLLILATYWIAIYIIALSGTRIK